MDQVPVDVKYGRSAGFLNHDMTVPDFLEQGQRLVFLRHNHIPDKSQADGNGSNRWLNRLSFSCVVVSGAGSVSTG